MFPLSLAKMLENSFASYGESLLPYSFLCPECRQSVVGKGNKRTIQPHQSFDELCLMSDKSFPLPYLHPVQIEDWPKEDLIKYRKWKGDEKRRNRKETFAAGVRLTYTLCKNGKRSFSTEMDAELAATSLMIGNIRKRQSEKTTCRTYLCDVCNEWHITTMSSSDKLKLGIK